MSRLICLVCLLSLVVACSGPAPSQAQPSAIGLPATPPVPTSTTSATPEAAALTTHPRLWLTPALVNQLRGWAVESNPLYRDGLRPLVERATQEMDRGLVPTNDCGQRAYSETPTEMYAELFAFMSLIDPDPTQRAGYAQRARQLLMYVINQAALGPATEQTSRCPGDPETPVYPPFRDPAFFTEDSDRPRWYGEAFPLVVDWIYPSLTAEDKQAIRTVFSRWGDEIITRGYHHPEPVGLINDPALLANRSQVRWAGNNYVAAHMRNLGMMSLALDPADSNPQLQAYLANATGAWLYLFHHLAQTDAAGGLLPEGFEYSPQTASYLLQLYLTLATAQVDPAQYGQHIQLDSTAFWDDFITAYENRA